MTDKEIIELVKQVEGLGGMTVNERLFATGLVDEFEKAKREDITKAKRILELLQVDQSSIERITK